MLTFSQGTSALAARAPAKLFKQVAWKERTLPNHAISHGRVIIPRSQTINRESGVWERDYSRRRATSHAPSNVDKWKGVSRCNVSARAFISYDAVSSESLNHADYSRRVLFPLCQSLHSWHKETLVSWVLLSAVTNYVNVRSTVHAWCQTDLANRCAAVWTGTIEIMSNGKSVKST